MGLPRAETVNDAQFVAPILTYHQLQIDQIARNIFKMLSGDNEEPDSVAEFQKVWSSMLHEYSQTVLSNDDDRLSVLAGIAQPAAVSSESFVRNMARFYGQRYPPVRTERVADRRSTRIQIEIHKNDFYHWSFRRGHYAFPHEGRCSGAITLMKPSNTQECIPVLSQQMLICRGDEPLEDIVEL